MKKSVFSMISEFQKRLILKVMKGKYNLNIEYFIKFIKKIEKIAEKNSNSYLKMALDNANEYAKYGEYELALDIALDNLCEGSILLEQEVIYLARQAYAKSITLQKALLLEMLTKQ